jgi:hypothetical protein
MAERNLGRGDWRSLELRLDRGSAAILNDEMSVVGQKRKSNSALPSSGLTSIADIARFLVGTGLQLFANPRHAAQITEGIATRCFFGSTSHWGKRDDTDSRIPPQTNSPKYRLRRSCCFAIGCARYRAGCEPNAYQPVDFAQ